MILQSKMNYQYDWHRATIVIIMLTSAILLFIEAIAYSWHLFGSFFLS